MISIKDYLAEALLVEANVVNLDAIDVFVGTYMRATKLPQGKEWLKTKLRKFLINSPTYLVKLNKDHLPAGLPDYAMKALDAGEDVFVFDANSLPYEFKESLQHVLDWFEAMHRTIEAGPDSMNDVSQEDFRLTQKEVEKLRKINLDQITAAADSWFNHMGTRLRGQKKEMAGVEIIVTWPDGYYAVRYTDLTVMRQDGRDLQNCLQHGTYWDAVRRGENQVFGIRKPNDEAVVGIRTKKTTFYKGPNAAHMYGGDDQTKEWHLQECKGKANKPPIPAYIPYVVGFLQKMDTIDIEGCPDLVAAGVFFRDGKFGTFKDISELVYQDRGVEIRRTDDQFEMVTAAATHRGEIRGGHVTRMNLGDLVGDTLSHYLTALGLPPAKEMLDTLQHRAVYFNAGKYGTPRTIGTNLGTVDGMTMYEVKGLIFSYDDENKMRFGAGVDDKGVISSLRYFDAENPSDVSELAAFFNHLGRKITVDVEVNRLGALCWNGEHFGEAGDVGTALFDRDGEILYRMGRRNMWVLDQGHAQPFHIGVVRGRLTVLEGDDDESVAATVRFIASHFPEVVKSVGNSDTYGVLNIARGGVIADKKTFFAKLARLSTLMKKKDTENLQYAISDTLDDFPPQARSILHCIRAVLVNDAHEQLSKDELRQLDEAFRAEPAAPLWVEEMRTNKLFDLVIKGVRFHFPMGLSRLHDALSETPPKDAKAEMTKALKQAFDFLKENEHVDVLDSRNWDRDAFEELGLLDEVNRLLNEIRAHRERSNIARREREHNTDKYATDVSSRFAALNALRKSKE